MLPALATEIIYKEYEGPHPFNIVPWKLLCEHRHLAPEGGRLLDWTSASLRREMFCSLSMFETFISSVFASRGSPCARLSPPSIEPSVGPRLPDEPGIGLSVVWFRQKVVPSRCVATFVELRHSLGAPMKRALLRRFP